jgi:cardiolipin synthase
VWARGIAEGPDEDIDKLHWVLMGALACARESVVVVTPYFLPDQLLIAALNTAALRGVRVQILLPAHNNLVLVRWASTAVLPQLFASGCELFAVGEMFDHTKLLLVDDVWSLIGSANWDPRSLRLNFEFNIECYSRPLAATLRERVNQKLRGARRITARELAARPFPFRLRDSLAHLLSPYL